MRYYGSITCTGCKVTKKLMDKYGVPYEYIDVSRGFEGEIPMLELDSGQFLTGSQAIIQWIRRNYR